VTEQQQPQWSPPPQQTTGWGAGGPAPVERPMGVTLAAIYLIVMGVLMGLLGACVGLIGGAAGGLEGQMPGIGMLGGAIAVFGIIILVLGILQIVAGAGSLSGKGWARWTGIAISVIVVVLTVLGALGSLAAGQAITDMLLTIVIGVLYALTAWALFQATGYFAARR
jgi:hypothetical protein